MTDFRLLKPGVIDPLGSLRSEKHMFVAATVCLTLNWDRIVSPATPLRYGSRISFLSSDLLLAWEDKPNWSFPS